MKLLFTILLLGTMSAQASHYSNCLMTAEVQEIINLDKLGGETRVFRGVIESERNQLIKFKVLKTTSVRGYDCSRFNNRVFTLYIDSSEVDKYSKGQELMMRHINVGDSRSNSTTWKIDK